MGVGMNKWSLLFLACLLTLATAQNTDRASYITWLQNDKPYTGAHDPGIIRDERGVYTLVSTNNLLTLSQSTDMLNWNNVGSVLRAVPTWMSSVYSGIENIWAPHLAYMNGKYWLYYCGSVFGKNTSLIGAFSNPTLDVKSPNYKWTDIGEIWRSTTSNNYNAIDPELLVDAQGKAWLSFGSFWQGMRMIAIDPSTGKPLSSDKTLYSTASRGGGAIEGPSTLYRDGYYYLFTSWDKCCDGAASTYRTMMGRSTTPTGPYKDKSGKDLMSSGGTQMIAAYGHLYGPGGGSPFVDGRRTFYALHYYGANNWNYLSLRSLIFDSDKWAEFGQPFMGRYMAFEAEHAKINSATIHTSTTASAGEYVGHINDDNSYVEFVADILGEGDYWIEIRYAAGDGAATHELTVNGGSAETVNYSQTSNWGNFPVGRTVLKSATLQQGKNTIRLTKGTGFAELDRIDLIRKASSPQKLGAYDRSFSPKWIPEYNGVKLLTGSWTQYENMGFDGGGYRYVNLKVRSGSCKLTLKLGSAGSISQEVDVSASLLTNEISLNNAFMNAKGVHDLYIATNSGDCDLESIRFAENTTRLQKQKPTMNSSSLGKMKSFNLLGQKVK